ncbi:MAG: class B sortase [Clostridia bacterium]|nr:class B sortase [Clostridia bacterium]
MIKAVRALNSLVDMAILAVILFLVAIGCYAMWDSNQIFGEADASQYEIYKPGKEGQKYSFEELQSINPEVFGWLTVYGTHIDYPLVQGPNNMKYINTNALGKYAFAGAIFLDMRCEKDFSGFTSVIHGHHMEKNAMFGDLAKFKDKGFFNARRYGMLYYAGQEHGLEFFAFLHVDAYNQDIYRFKITGQEEKQAYIETLFNTAIHTRNVEITPQDRLVLLSTCSSSTTNGRDILIARITEELYEDTFKTIATDKDKPTIDGLLGLWAEMPAWARIVITAAGLMLILFLFFLIFTRLNKRRIPARKGEH